MVGTTQLIMLGFRVATALAAGIPGAIEAARTIERMNAENREPTPEEWDELNAVAAHLHGRLQRAAGNAG